MYFSIFGVVFKDMEENSVRDEESSLHLDATLSNASGIYPKGLHPGKDYSKMSSTISLVNQGQTPSKAKHKKELKVKVKNIHYQF